MSGSPNGLITFAIKHPIVTPANAGNPSKNGSGARASLNRT